MSAFQHEIDIIFFLKKWTMHILDQVFLRKIVDYMVKKLTSAQFFLFMLFSSTPLHGVNINLAIVVTYVVFAKDMKKK